MRNLLFARSMQLYEVTHVQMYCLFICLFVMKVASAVSQRVDLAVAVTSGQTDTLAEFITQLDAAAVAARDDVRLPHFTCVFVIET
jgi:hypothetical protein